MNKITIYRAVVGAMAVLAGSAQIENVWGHEMLVKTIDAGNKDEVEAHKADGWHDNPQKVIDGFDDQPKTLGILERLESENQLLREKVEALTTELTMLKAEAEKAKPKARKKSTDEPEADNDTQT